MATGWKYTEWPGLAHGPIPGAREEASSSQARRIKCGREVVSSKENQEWGMNAEQAETIEVCSGTEEGASARVRQARGARRSFGKGEMVCAKN